MEPGQKRVRFSRVRADPPLGDRPAIVVASGPSLIGRDLSRLRERGWVIGVNRAADEVPCDATCSVDMVFANRRQVALRRWSEAGQEVYLAVPEDYARPAIPTVTYIKRLPGQGCSRDPGAIINGLNSGSGALQVAILRGARRVYMLGFDLVDPGDGPVQWHSGYGNPGSRNAVRRWPEWIKRFEVMARDLPAGVEVLNANPDSAIRGFPFTTYEELGL